MAATSRVRPSAGRQGISDGVAWFLTAFPIGEAVILSQSIGDPNPK